MALHKGLLNGGVRLPNCEKHFHDHDETWVILQGKGTGYWINRTGKRKEFELEAGDVWMIPVGYEHGSDGFEDTGKNSNDFMIAIFSATQPEGSHKPGHYHVEKEGYIPSLELKKTPTDRYTNPLNLPGKMYGITFLEKGKASLQDEPTPECIPGTVLCKTLYSGLTNGTERNVLMGGNYGGFWPVSYGYQKVGLVLAVGAGVHGFQVGDTIFAGEWFGDSCGHRQYFAAPTTKGMLIVKLPETVDRKHAALFGVASVAMHDMRRAGVKLGEKVLVVGAGLIGQFTMQMARLTGALVTICDLNEHRLTIARDLGAHTTIPVTLDPESWEAVKQAGPFDVIFEDSGAPILDSVFGVGFDHQGVVKHRSRVVIIAGRDRVDYNFNAGQGDELTVFHAAHFVLDDLQQVCRLTAEGCLKIGPIIQDVVKIQNAIPIYDALRDRPDSLLGAVFDWT